MYQVGGPLFRRQSRVQIWRRLGVLGMCAARNQEDNNRSKNLEVRWSHVRMCLHLFSPIRRSKDRFRLSCWFARSLKEPWREVLKVAAPRLPLVVGSRGFVEDVLNVCFEQRGVQPLKSCAHSLRLGCPHS